MLPVWVSSLASGLGLIRFLSYAKDALKRLYEAVRRKEKPLSAEELVRYDSLYINIAREMLGKAHKLFMRYARELRLAGLTEEAVGLGGIDRQLKHLREDLKVVLPPPGGRYDKRVLDYVNLAVMRECHRIYELAEGLPDLLGRGVDLTGLSRDVSRAARKARMLRNLLSWALSHPSSRDFLEALRAEAVREMDEEKAGIYGEVLEVAQILLMAELASEKKVSHKKLASEFLAVIRRLTPTGRPYVSLDKIYSELCGGLREVDAKTLKKSISYLEKEGLIPEVRRRQGSILVLRPEGLEPEIKKLVRLVKHDRKLREDGFSMAELMVHPELGWDKEVIEEVLEKMEESGLAWRRITPSGPRWYIPAFYYEEEAKAGAEAIEYVEEGAEVEAERA